MISFFTKRPAGSRPTRSTTLLKNFYSISEKSCRRPPHSEHEAYKKCREFQNVRWMFFWTIDHYLLAIVLHKIPVGIVFYQFIRAVNLQSVLTWLLITIFALMTPLGSLSTEYFAFFKNFEIELFAFSAGLLIHIASIILFESDDKHQLNLRKLIVVLLGVGLAYLL